MSYRAWSTGLLLCFACSDGTPLFEVGEGELMVVAFLDAQDQIAVEVSTGRLRHLELRPDSIAAIWRIRADELIRPDGSRYSVTELNGIQGGVDEFGTCGCPVPRIDPTGPLVGGEGAACSLGRAPDQFWTNQDGDLRSREEHEQASELARRVKLVFPGECGCRPARIAGIPPRLANCPLLPEGAAHAINHIAINAAGDIMAAAALRTFSFPVDGERTDNPLSESRFPEFLGDVPGGFLLSTRDFGDVLRQTDHVLIKDDGTEETPDVDPSLSPWLAQTIHDDVWLAGIKTAAIVGYDTAVERCDRPLGSCERILLSKTATCGWGALSEGIRAVLPWGEHVVAVSPRGGLAIGDATSTTMQCVLEASSEVDGEPISYVNAATVWQDQLVLCGRTSVPGGACGSSHGGLWFSKGSHFVPNLVRTATNASTCDSVDVLPSGELLATFGTRGVVFDLAGGRRDVAIGAPSGTLPVLYPGLGGDFDEQVIRGSSTLLKRSGELFRWKDERLEKVYGRGSDAGSWVTALTVDDRAIVLRAGADAVELSGGAGGCDSIGMQPAEGLEAIPSNERPARALSVLDSQTFVVIGTDSVGNGYLRTARRGSPWIRTALPFSPSDLAELSPGLLVVLGGSELLEVELTAEGTVLRMEPVTVQSDDPSTEEVEQAPVLGCGQKRFQRISGQDGVGFVSGPGTVVRLTLGGSGTTRTRAEGYWFLKFAAVVAETGAVGAPTPSALQVSCGGAVDLAMELTPDITALSPRTNLVQYRPKASQCDALTTIHSEGWDGAFCRFQDEDSVFARVSDTKAVVRQSSAVAFINSGGLTLRPPLNQHFEIGHAVHRAVLALDDAILAWHDGGLLSVSVSRGSP